MNLEDRLNSYPCIKRTHDEAISAALDLNLSGEDLDYYMSKNCRIWFFEKHLKVEREASDQEVRDIAKSPIVPFELSDLQLSVIEMFEKRMHEGKKFRQRIMKCRRARISTIFLAIGYHMIRFNQNKKGLVFCDRLETSRKLRRILDIFYQTDDLMFKPEIGKKTLAEGLYLHPPDTDRNNTEKDSFILLGSGEQKNSGVGGSLDFMHWSEAALTPDAETHWTTISPSLQGALFDVAESTPSMTGQDAVIFPEFENPSSNCDCKFISWLDVKEYRIDDEILKKDFAPYVDHNLYGKEAEIMGEHDPLIEQMLWRRFKLDEIKNLNAFKNVFPISKEEAFYSSAGLFFHKTIIEATTSKEPIKAKSINFSDQGAGVSMIVSDAGAWKIYRDVFPSRNYLVTTDIAEGKCSDREMRDPDYSVAMVFTLDNPVEEVAIFRDRIPPEVLSEQVACAARYYNDALIIPELNGPGLAFLVRLRQLYTNIYRQQKYISGSFIMTDEYGFRTTSATKLHALSCLLTQIREKGKGLIIHSDIVRKEMSKFAQQGMRYGALPGGHDDTITNLWLMAICISQTPSLIRSRELDGQSPYDMKCFEPKIDREHSGQFNPHA